MKRKFDKTGSAENQKVNNIKKKAYRQLKLLKKNRETIEVLKKNLIEDRLKIQKQIIDFLSKTAYNLSRNILLLFTVTERVLSMPITK
ncbi:hypothetical protein JCM31739_02580 [Faecalimonas canis]